MLTGLVCLIMRKDGILLILALALAFLSGKIMFSIQEENQIGFNDLESIRLLHSELRESVPPKKRLDLNLFYNDPEKLKLLETTKEFSSKTITLNSSECLRAKIEQISSSFINKENLWLSFLCHQITSLPISFFKSPPYIHSNGLSYSYMRYRMIKSQSVADRFLEEHAQYMHIAELKKLNYKGDDDALSFLLKLDTKDINKIVSESNVFMNEQLYFIRTGHLQYYIVGRKQAETFFRLARYQITESYPGCDLNILDVCWKKQPHNLTSFLSQSSSVLFIFTLIFLVFIAANLSGRIRRQKIEEERKKHALRVLTHELRTPIAALMLQLNNLEDDDMPTGLREKLAQIEGEVYRLKFLADRSRSYLQTDQKKSQVFQVENIDSLKEIIDESLTDFPTKNIELDVLYDEKAQIDPYWLKICLKNLIENAIRYGKEPIHIKLNGDKNNIIITVKDQGSIPYINIKEALRAKHQNSVGLGLGLGIVNKTIKQMGGKLTLETSPTRFSMHIPRRQNGKNSLS